MADLKSISVGGTPFSLKDEVARDMISDIYNPTQTYEADHICIYNGKLYKATKETTGTWDETAWEETNVGAINTEISKIKTGIGTTSISDIGDGTLTGGVSSLNTKTTALQTQCDSGTVNQATKWNGYTINANVVNTTDTWIPIFHGNELQHTTQTGIVNLAWNYIDTLTSPSQIKSMGFYSIGTCGSAINDNAYSGKTFTEWDTGDFAMYVFAKTGHLSSTNGCRYGTAFIASSRFYANFWVAQIWEYKFIRFQKLGS